MQNKNSRHQLSQILPLTECLFSLFQKIDEFSHFIFQLFSNPDEFPVSKLILSFLKNLRQSMILQSQSDRFLQ